MVRTVVKTKEIAHLFANQVQDYATTYNRSFDGKKYYSYSTEIACYRSNSRGEECLILDDYSFSCNTAKHQSELRRACSHLTVFDYESNRYRSSLFNAPSTVTVDFIYNYYIEKATELQSKFNRARKNKLSLFEQAKHYLVKANQLIDFFDATHLERLDEDQFNELLVKLATEHEELLRKEKEEEAIRLAMELEYYKSDFHDWLTGNRVTFPRCYNNNIYLRVKDDMVETSRGATFPVSSCETLFKLYQRCVRDNEVYDDNIQVGNYRVNHISRKGIIAGCHHIKPDEITRFAEILGLLTT